MNNKNNTLAIVTGAAKGNGYAIASGYENAKIRVLSIDLERTNFTYNIKGDVTKSNIHKEINNILDDVFYDNLILVNNAGITRPHKSPYPKEEWELTMQVNLTAPFLLIENLISYFKQIKKGSIINITSLAAERSFPDNPSYIASKGGLKMLTKFYAKSLGQFGIRANNVGPGYMITDMTHQSYINQKTRDSRSNHTFLKRWGKSEDLVGICIFLSSDEAV